MKALIQEKCVHFIQNRDIIKETFRMENGYLYPVCANLFLSRNVQANEEKLRQCREMIKMHTGVFSNFRGMIRLPLECLLSMEEKPEEKLQQMLALYDMLKKEFFTSQFLPLAAFLLTGLEHPEEKVIRGKGLYQKMKKEHPFLTSSEDSVFAVMLACSEKTDDELMLDMEKCYTLVKQHFSSGNPVQTVSHVLALKEGMPEEKVSRMMEMYDAIRASGKKYGKYYELATLAAFSILEGNVQEMVMDLMDADDFLAQQKGYGFFSIDKKTRMMHAAMIVSNAYLGQSPVNEASLASTMSMIIAQQVAAFAAISSAASVSAASN